MTEAKKEALEIVEKYKLLVNSRTVDNYFSEVTREKNSIQCAIITVEKEIQLLYLIMSKARNDFDSIGREITVLINEKELVLEELKQM